MMKHGEILNWKWLRKSKGRNWDGTLEPASWWSKESPAGRHCPALWWHAPAYSSAPHKPEANMSHNARPRLWNCGTRWFFPVLKWIYTLDVRGQWHTILEILIGCHRFSWHQAVPKKTCLVQQRTAWIIIFQWNLEHQLVGGWPTPLKNDGVRQLGWLFHSQYMETHSKFHGSSHHQPVPLIIPIISHY